MHAEQTDALAGLREKVDANESNAERKLAEIKEELTRASRARDVLDQYDEYRTSCQRGDAPFQPRV